MRTKRLLWAAAGVVVVLLAGVGVVMALRGGADDPDPVALPSSAPSTVPPTSASPAPPAGADITGPLDLLIIGVDTRITIADWQPHADAIMLLHVDAGL